MQWHWPALSLELYSQDSVSKLFTEDYRWASCPGHPMHSVFKGVVIPSDPTHELAVFLRWKEMLLLIVPPKNTQMKKKKLSLTRCTTWALMCKIQLPGFSPTPSLGSTLFIPSNTCTSFTSRIFVHRTFSVATPTEWNSPPIKICLALNQIYFFLYNFKNKYIFLFRFKKKKIWNLSSCPFICLFVY